MGSSGVSQVLSEGSLSPNPGFSVMCPDMSLDIVTAQSGQKTLNSWLSPFGILQRLTADCAVTGACSPPISKLPSDQQLVYNQSILCSYFEAAPFS